ncbi:bifunctional (p)ppGpp synthetase/guanosine-3',5'-bis(diphosphate) 3'-pyrophosphohydrolase [Lampropedia puyangensis]|uniref:Bifunctional (P)ppGpp synthetase/guanosine-3',5'-bis(Diphosphate) 3'-pyrophosphohydrolase n=1 Tax=Lampropedia puyangensis TaxID=1330072 RepID=A0A4S8F9Y5_9BURK|nr:bifunctional (p)ppGpp synthetase/guanosine-3',5'-bis(diphosphate) 3'-pyrophosphohydrolase [Lampropedia puyangensis]THU04077.1 bifunctional (p)ppGpp synthetase/guanosine-3',5'-bis(diphosphate) 3'-pyrophosphohydrolase [Lampropedia puyangensis]
MKSAGLTSPYPTQQTPVFLVQGESDALTPEHRLLVNQAYADFSRMIEYLPEHDQQRVHTAFAFAERAHSGQYRNSGEPYITHPIAVAALCSQWHLDAPALMAALMHDAMEDCGVTRQDIEGLFGDDVAELVDGLTKLEKLEFHSREENQAQSFRKMLLAMAKDVRVILIKLADRTHNMRTLSVAPRNKWGRISRETLEIYAPISNRLGLNATYRELQELSFQHLHPWRYQTLSKAVEKVKSRRRGMADRIQAELEKAFAQRQLKVRLLEREQTLYKVYLQMTSKGLSFAKVSDIFGVQVLCDSVTDCYTGLGVVHQTYRPVPGYFKDYIASPKPNGYQSLHTSLLGPSSVEVEVELRTEMMHVVAETGIAAHWLYQSKGLDRMLADSLNGRWLESMLEIEHSSNDASDFLSDVKVDLHPESVYVFTPKNQIVTLPIGATVVDFAYAIHSNVGDHIAAAQVNGSVVSLRTILKNGDTIEILTSDDARPHPGWLEFVKTGRARSRIRNQLKNADQQETLGLGHKLLSQAMRVAGYADLPETSEFSQAVWQQLAVLHQGKSREQMLQEIGLGRMIASELVTQIGQLLQGMGLKPDALVLSKERLMTSGGAPVVLAVGGADGAPVRYAACCRPLPGDVIVGLLISGKGLEVHRKECSVAARRLKKDTSTAMPVEWSDEPVGDFEAAILLNLRNSKGALAEASAVIAQSEVNILRIDMLEEGRLEAIEIRITVALKDAEHLEQLLKSLRRVRAVQRVERYLAE